MIHGRPAPGVLIKYGQKLYESEKKIDFSPKKSYIDCLQPEGCRAKVSRVFIYMQAQGKGVKNKVKGVKSRG